MKRYPGRLLAATVALTLAACGGGGGDPVPAGTCQRAAIPSTGPGDTLHYFPAEVGRTWTYRNESSGQTAAGTFVDVAHVQSIARVHATATTAGVLDVVVTQDDWFAKDVGRVNSLLTIAAPSIGYSEQETISLQSWTVPSGAALVAAPLAASLGAEPGRPERLEATALRVVREVLAARR